MSKDWTVLFLNIHQETGGYSNVLSRKWCEKENIYIDKRWKIRINVLPFILIRKYHEKMLSDARWHANRCTRILYESCGCSHDWNRAHCVADDYIGAHNVPDRLCVFGIILVFVWLAWMCKSAQQTLWFISIWIRYSRCTFPVPYPRSSGLFLFLTNIKNSV